MVAPQDWGQLSTEHLVRLLGFTLPHVHQEGMKNVLTAHIMTLSGKSSASSQAEPLLVGENEERQLALPVLVVLR